MLEYFLENSEYEREIAEGRVHYSEQENIMETDGVNEGLVNSLGNSSENSLGKVNQHTDVLIVKENSRKHTKLLVEERNALRPYDFCFNNHFKNADFVDAKENLTPLGNQIKEEENSVEDFNPWNEEIGLLEIMLNKQDSIVGGRTSISKLGIVESEDAKE